MRRSLFVITVAAILVALCVALLEHNATRHARSEASASMRRGEMLDAEISRAREQLAETVRTADNLSAALRVSLAPATTESKPTDTPPPRRPLGDLMQADPALDALVRKWLRAELMLYGGRFYAKAGLSPEQIEKLQALKLDAELDKIDLYATAKSQGLAEDDPALAKARKEADERSRNAQRELLGEAAFAEMKRAERDAPLINFVMQIARLAPIEEPLTPAQSDQLIELLGNAGGRNQKGGFDPAVVDPATVTQQTALFLTPAQQAALTSMSHHFELQRVNREFFQQKKAAAK